MWGRGIFGWLSRFFWGEDERGFVEAVTDEVDGREDFWATDELGFKPAFSREVKQRHADEHRKDSLSGEEEHQEACGEEHGTE